MTISGRRYPDGGDSVQLLFDGQQRAVAGGMPFVLYDGSTVVGGRIAHIPEHTKF